MKKFTLIVALLVIALLGKAEISTNLQKKVLKLKAKTDQILQKNAFLTKKSGASKSSVHKFPVYLNSTETQKLDSIVSRTYDTGSSSWKYDWMDVYEYDAQMRSTFWYEKEWNDEMGVWDVWSKTETGYGTNGEIESLLLWNFDEMTGELIYDTKMAFFLNQDAKLDSTVIYMVEPDGTLTTMYVQKYQYDGSGNVIQSEIWTMEEDDNGMPTGMLLKSMIIKYEYNSSGLVNLMSTLYYVEGEEIPYSQSEYSYNSSGQLTSAVFSALSFSTFQMEIQDKADYLYNSAGDIDTEIDSDWNTAGWTETFKYENTYSNDNFSDVIFPSYINLIFGIGDPEMMLFNKVIISDKTSEMINGDWVQTDEANYYYSGGTTNVNDLDNLSVSFYPNPASNEITLTWSSSNKSQNLQIFQISGVKVLDENTFSGEKVSVSHLLKGMYLVKLLNGQQTVYAGKLIKN